MGEDDGRESDEEQEQGSESAEHVEDDEQGTVKGEVRSVRRRSTSLYRSQLQMRNGARETVSACSDSVNDPLATQKQDPFLSFS